MKRSKGEIIFNFFNIIFMTSLMIITIYPLIYVLFSSVSDPKQLEVHTGILLKPLGFTLKGYKLVLDNPNILVGYKNTMMYVAIGTTINLIMTSLGAYLLSRKTFMLKNVMMFFIVFTMFFSGGLIPKFLLIRNLGMLNTIWAIVVPNAISAWNLILMRTSFAEIPDSLEESARIDGANDFTILVRIILPLSLPIIAVMILFYGVGYWNAWFDAMIYLRNRALYPLQLFLREILVQNDTNSMTSKVMTSLDKNEDELYKNLIKYCTIVVSTLPILCIYPFLQKYFVKGVMIGAVKG
jgi:putative aldouronate transport system permease protein